MNDILLENKCKCLESIDTKIKKRRGMLLELNYFPQIKFYFLLIFY